MQALQLLVSAEEFAEIPVRHNEEHLNADLNKTVREKLDSDMQSAHTKANLLLQVWFLQAPQGIHPAILFENGAFLREFVKILFVYVT